MDDVNINRATVMLDKQPPNVMLLPWYTELNAKAQSVTARHSDACR